MYREYPATGHPYIITSRSSSQLSTSHLSIWVTEVRIVAFLDICSKYV